jgi:hypothetical protein
VTAPDEVAALVEKARLSARVLSELIEPASAAGGELVDAIRTTLDEVQRRLAGSETTIALRGEATLTRPALVVRAWRWLTRWVAHLFRRRSAQDSVPRPSAGQLAELAMAVRQCIVRVSEEGLRAEATCEKRIAALERQRIPDPREFRAQQLLRVDSAIEQGARDVEGSTLLCWREKVAHTKRAWHLDLQACTDRKDVARVIERLNQRAATELQARVDDTVEHAIADLQRTSETIQIWLLEEIHARYHVARREEEGASPAAVVGEAIDMPVLGRTPLESTLDKFETRRVDLGLGGAAAGAMVGTLIVPGIGTAIGAFVGVFAGLLRGVDSLKQECVARLDECMSEIEHDVAVQIAGRRSSFEEALRASLHDALDQALERRQESIARLTALERKVLDAEYEKRAKLAKLRAVVDRHDGL